MSGEIIGRARYVVKVLSTTFFRLQTFGECDVTVLGKMCCHRLGRWQSRMQLSAAKFFGSRIRFARAWFIVATSKESH
jgi:hypothetical protein